MAETEFLDGWIDDHRDHTDAEVQSLRAVVSADIDEAVRTAPNNASLAIAALRDLYEACVSADSINELSPRIDGSLLDRARIALQQQAVA